MGRNFMWYVKIDGIWHMAYLGDVSFRTLCNLFCCPAAIDVTQEKPDQLCSKCMAVQVYRDTLSK